MNIIKLERNPQPYLMLDTYPVHVPGLICPYLRLPYLQDLHVHVYIYLTTGMYLCTCRTTWTYMNLVLPEGTRKLGGRRGCSRRGTFVHALLCSTALLTFVSKYSDFFLRMTQHVIYSQVYVIINGSVCGWGGGGGCNCCQRGGISYAMGEGGGEAAPPPPPPPTPKAMLDPGLHGIYLDLL